MRTGSIIAVLLGPLAWAVWIAYRGLSMHADVEVPTSLNVALVAMVVLTLAVGSGLMALVFYSSRKGHDQAAGRMHTGPADER